MTFNESNNSPDTSSSEIPEIMERVASVLPEISRQAPELLKAVAELERQVRLARGTGDVTKLAAAVAGLPGVPVAKITPTPAPPPDLRDRVRGALMHESLNIQRLAKAVAEPANKVADLIKTLRQEKMIYNVGTAENPIWTWRPGDDISSSALNSLVKRLISERPFTTKELAEATGARMTRVGGALVAIQRSGDRIVDLGTGHAGQWFLISERARDARLLPKVPPKESK